MTLRRSLAILFGSFRATGTTTYLENDGDPGTPHHIAVLPSANTTRIHAPRGNHMEQEENERVRIQGHTLSKLGTTLSGGRQSRLSSRLLPACLRRPTSRRKINSKAAALPFLTFKIDRSAVGLHETPNDRQA